MAPSGPGSMSAGTISAADDVDLYLLPEGTFKITVTPSAGLDTALNGGPTVLRDNLVRNWGAFFLKTTAYF